MSSAFPQTFFHKGSNRRYWWSAAENCYVFEDGERRHGAPPPPAPARDQSIPRYVPAEQSQRPAPGIPPIEWKLWRRGQPIGKGQTILIQAGEGEPPLTPVKPLGAGMYAQVSQVEIDGTPDTCALKVYKSNHSTETFRAKFENEIHNMRRVSNRHIASFFAAYIYERKNQLPEFGILMKPVADGTTLEYLISACRNSPTKVLKQHRECLMKSFGCLSSALGFVHEHMMRHKDVKPGNILIHEGKVLLADFGSSFDGYGTRTLTTHDPIPKGHTPRYAAPEVNTNDPRSVKSDIFSLGGVFYEIFCALEPEAWLNDEDFCRVIKQVRTSLVQWRNTLPEVMPCISLMLDPVQDRRPSARDIVGTLSSTHFCTKCRQEHHKGEFAGSMTEKPEQLMGRLNIRPKEGVAAGPSSRRQPAPATSASQGQGRAYAPSTSDSRGRKAVEEDEEDEQSSDEDEDSNDSD